MKPIFTLLGIILFLHSAPCFGQTPKSKLSATDKAFILSRFNTEVKYNFAFYDKLGFDLDSLCMASMPALTATYSDDDFLKGMQALCSRLRDGHTYVFPMNNPEKAEDWIRPLPIKTKRIADRVFVVEVLSSVLQKAGVNPGCEILEIDGENVIEYASRHIQPYLTSSTPQWSKYRPFAEFELTKDKGSKVSKIIFRDKKGKKFTVESNRNIPWDLKINNSTMNLSILKGNVGLLTVGSFQDSDFDRSYFGELYNDILKTDALIIDIRGNGGGNSSHADYFISHFCDKPVPQGKWRSPMYIAAHASWNYPKE